MSSFPQEQNAAYQAGLVRVYRGSRVIGAGFYLGNAYLLTCAHVVIKSLGLNSKTEATEATAVAGQSVEVDFPFVAAGQRYSAQVVADLWRSQGQDMAGLQLLAKVPDGVKPIPLVWSNHYYRDHDYYVYGFPAGQTDGLEANGKLLGELVQGWVQMEDEHTTGVPIEPGFSGAPVWDKQLGGVVGMTVARDKERKEAKLGFMIPYDRLLPTLNRLDILVLDALLNQELGQLTSIWLRVYRDLCPRDYTESEPTDLRGALVNLQEMPSQGKPYSPLVYFVSYFALADLGLSQDGQQALRQWLAAKGIDPENIRGEVTQLGKLPAIVKPYLLFKVELDVSSDRYRLEAHLVENSQIYQPEKRMGQVILKQSDDTFNQTQVQQKLIDCLNQTATYLDDTTELTIAIFLPMSCLHWEVDQWPVSNIPAAVSLGYKYPVVVCSTDRLSQAYLQFRSDWQAKWRRVMLQLGCPDPPDRCFICGDRTTPKSIFRLLRQPDQIGLRLHQDLPPFDEKMPSAFTALLQAGVPIALWPRQCGEAIGIDWVEIFDHLLANCLAELLPQVKRCREEAYDDCDEGESHHGQHISLLWDNPKMIPPSAVPAPRRLRMPRAS